MRPRHGRLPRSWSGSHLITAVQLDLPEAVVRARLKRADPNQSFAARQLYVSHADKPAPDVLVPVNPYDPRIWTLG
jgi:hypothetical protein